MTFATRILVSWVLATLAGCAHASDPVHAPAPMVRHQTAVPLEPANPVAPSEPTAPPAIYGPPPSPVPTSSVESMLLASPVEEVEAPTAPFTDPLRNAARPLEPTDVQVVLQVRGSRTGELSNGDLVQSGDRLQLKIASKTDSHLYLAYCNAKGSLTWFPPRGSIPAKADTLVTAPAERASIVLDDNPGPESLYLLISQQELSLADHELSQLIESSRAGGETPEASETHKTQDCKRPFIKRSPTKKPNQKGHRTPPAGAASADPAPTVELIRGGYIAWDDPQQVTARVDASGIAILRYAFTHVARRR